MDRVKYIDLLERRQAYGENVGALDFLIGLGEKRFFLSSPGEVYSERVSRSHKYNKIRALNKGIGKNPRSNEFVYLLDYAALLRNVQMTQTYVGLVRYLITKIGRFGSKHQNELLKHVRASYIVTGDESLLELLGSVSPELLGKVSLPKAIVQTLSDPVGGKVREGTTVHDAVFSHQNDIFQIERILENFDGELLGEQKHGLSMNRAAAKKDSDAYVKAINAMFIESDLHPIGSMSLMADNVISTVKVKNVPEAEDRGLVSVIMSCFESESTVGYALDSLTSQSYKNIEILVCDDGSEDGSLDAILDRASRDSRIKVYRSRSNQGTYNIRNALLSEAKGDFITFQDADDWSHPQRVEKQVEYLSSENVHVCSTRWIRVDPKGQAIFFVDGRAFRFCVVSTMVRRSVFSVVPRFRKSLVAADTEFHEACINFFGEKNVRVIDEPLILGLWGDGSLTKREGLQAENNGQVAEKRRNYSDIAAKQRVLGSELVTDAEIEQVLEENGIYREYQGVERVGGVSNDHR